MQGTVVSIEVSVGDSVHGGQALVVLESMKMEHVVAAEAAGVVRAIPVDVGATVLAGDPLVLVERGAVADGATDTVAGEPHDLERVRPDLAEAIERHAVGLDERRPDAVARR